MYHTKYILAYVNHVMISMITQIDYLPISSIKHSINNAHVHTHISAETQNILLKNNFFNEMGSIVFCFSKACEKA